MNAYKANGQSIDPDRGSPVWDTRCHGLHPETWHGRWQALAGGDSAEQTLRPARPRNDGPAGPPRGCHQLTWPLTTQGFFLISQSCLLDPFPHLASKEAKREERREVSGQRTSSPPSATMSII